MTFTTNRDHLSAALRKCAEMAHKTTIPILGCVLLRVHGDTLTLSATNLDMGIECSVKVEAGKDGAVCLPAKHLLSVVENCRELEVVVEVKGLQAVITSGKSRFKMAGLEAGEFPSMEKVSGPKIVIGEPELGRMIKATFPFVSWLDIPSKIILNGICFESKDGNLTLTATDGQRLATTTRDAKCAQGPGFILPNPAIPHLRRLIGFDKEATITASERRVSFETSLGCLWTKVIEGNYPNWRRVIPTLETAPIKIERELLKECISRGAMGSFKDDKHHGNMTLRIASGEMECSAASAQRGESVDSLAVDYSGPELALMVQPDFILQALTALDDDMVGLNYHPENNALLITAIAFTSLIKLLVPAKE